MKKITVALLSIMTLVAFVPNVHAQIASKAYVDQQDELKQDILGDGQDETGVVFATGTAGEVEYIGIDDEPEEDSENLISSGGVYTAINDLGSALEEALDEKDEFPTQNSTNLVESGGVFNAVVINAGDIANVASASVAKEQYVNDAFVKTDGSGNVTLVTGGVVSDADVNSAAAIQLGKLAFPTPSSECNTRGCMLMFYDGKYVWEVVARNTNETPSTAAGYVTATATTNTSSESSAFGTYPEEYHDCPNGSGWNTSGFRCATMM